MKKLLIALTISALSASAIAGEMTPEQYIKKIEDAHKTEAWSSKKGVSYDIDVVFGGNPMLKSAFTMNPAASKVNMSPADGQHVVFDGKDCWQIPADIEIPMARFHVLTWPYFMAIAHKLDDPGAKIEVLGKKKLDGKEYDTAKLSFGEGVGDAPDDWYIIYSDPETGLIKASAYIVTFMKSSEDANKSPSAIIYENYVDVDGVPVPTEWKFWKWSQGEEEDTLTSSKGDATLSNVKFIEPEVDTFKAPEGSKELPLAN